VRDRPAPLIVFVACPGSLDARQRAAAIAPVAVLSKIDLVVPQIRRLAAETPLPPSLPCAHIYFQIGYNFVFYFKDFRPILSWPGLSRPPTSGRGTGLWDQRRLPDVGPRDKPGDDSLLKSNEIPSTPGFFTLAGNSRSGSTCVHTVAHKGRGLDIKAFFSPLSLWERVG